MRGYLTHTNDVTVSLGENYFVRRTTHQAIGILARRREYVSTNLQNLEEEMDRLRSQVMIGRNLFQQNEITEITEAYESDGECVPVGKDEEDRTNDALQRARNWLKMSEEEAVAHVRDAQVQKKLQNYLIEEVYHLFVCYLFFNNDSILLFIG
jgi:unconventional prefoldin RPB5 interactor 1